MIDTVIVGVYLVSVLGLGLFSGGAVGGRLTRQRGDAANGPRDGAADVKLRFPALFRLAGRFCVKAEKMPRFLDGY